MKGVPSTWGQYFWGGKLPADYKRLSDAREIQSTHTAFAALFEDQTVRAWGNAKPEVMQPEYNKSYGGSNGYGGML